MEEMRMTDKDRSRTTTKEQQSTRSESAAGERIGGAYLFDQAFENYEQALKAGLRIQEEAAKWWNGMLNEMPMPGRWQKTAEGFLSDTIPTGQRQWMEDNLRI